MVACLRRLFVLASMVEVQLSTQRFNDATQYPDFHAAAIANGRITRKVKHHQRVHQPSNLERYVREFIYTTVAVNLWISTLYQGMMV